MLLVKSMVVFAIVLAIVLFALANVHHVPLHFVLGGPVNVKAIYLVLASYLLGIASAVYVFVVLSLHSRKKSRAAKKSELEDAEEEAA